MRGLGDLEFAVMDVLWRTDDPMPVRDVHNALAGERVRAYTTIMTVLDNLHRKGYVGRSKHGKAFFYTASTSRAQAAADAIREVLSETDDVESVLLQFAISVSDGESRALRNGLNRRKRKQ